MFDFHRRKLESLKKPKVKDIDHKEYEHRQSLNVMVKIIHQCDMPEHIKKVMITRIWGLNPDEFNPLTAFQIAYLNKGGRIVNDKSFKYGRVPTEPEVLLYDSSKMPSFEEIQIISDYEKTGKFYCQQFLLASHAQEIVDKFNENKGKNTNEIFTKTNFEKKRMRI